MSKKKEPIPQRFYVEWHPTAQIEAACILEGQKPNDQTSFWDWVEPHNFRKTQVFQNFDDAVRFAMGIADKDCFGGARVYRQLQTVVKDGRRTFIRWDDECFWDGINAQPDADGKIDSPDINKPDEWCGV